MGAKLTASDLRKRKKEDLFIYGYPVQNASDLTSSVDVTQNKIDIYGEDDPITENTVNNGTLNVTIYEKNDWTIQALLTGQNPASGASAAQRYYYDIVNSLCSWVNIKNSANAQYVGSILYDGWTPTPGTPTGGAGEKATRNYSGQCSIPKEFNRPISALKGAATSGASEWVCTAITYSGSASGDILADPSAAGVKALKCFTVSGTGQIVEVKVSSGTLTYSAGWIIHVPNADTSLLSTDTGAYLYVVVLFDPTKGVYPTTGLPIPHTIKG